MPIKNVGGSFYGAMLKISSHFVTTVVHLDIMDQHLQKKNMDTGKRATGMGVNYINLSKILMKKIR